MAAQNVLAHDDCDSLRIHCMSDALCCASSHIGQIHLVSRSFEASPAFLNTFVPLEQS
jgi:hypothetical protein